MTPLAVLIVTVLIAVVAVLARLLHTAQRGTDAAFEAGFVEGRFWALVGDMEPEQ